MFNNLKEASEVFAKGTRQAKILDKFWLVENLEEASEAFTEGASDPFPKHLARLSWGLRCCHCRLTQQISESQNLFLTDAKQNGWKFLKFSNFRKD